MSNLKKPDDIKSVNDHDPIENNNDRSGNAKLDNTKFGNNRSDLHLKLDQSVRIRPAQTADISAIIKLEKSCFRKPWSDSAIEQDVSTNSNAYYFVGETITSHQVIAFAACWHMVDEAELMRIATHPDYRRNGLAEQLLIQVIQNAKAHQLHSMFLEVRPSNQAARALYQRHGFQILHIRRKYYDDNGEDAIIMSKKLN